MYIYLFFPISGRRPYISFRAFHVFSFIKLKYAMGSGCFRQVNKSPPYHPGKGE
jgi:hypothetical protein